MKKTGTVIGALLFMLLFISGCTKAIPAEEAANIMIDTMIYDQQTEAFQTNFANSEELTEIFIEQRTLFEENFTQGILQTGEAVSACDSLRCNKCAKRRVIKSKISQKPSRCIM